MKRQAFLALVLLAGCEQAKPQKSTPIVDVPRKAIAKPLTPAEQVKEDVRALDDVEKVLIGQFFKERHEPLDAKTIKSGSAGTIGKFKVIQVVNKRTVLATMGRETVIIDNFDTFDMVDGRTYDFTGKIGIVLGTETYNDAGGSTTTVFAITVLTGSKYEELANRLKAAVN